MEICRIQCARIMLPCVKLMLIKDLQCWHSIVMFIYYFLYFSEDLSCLHFWVLDFRPPHVSEHRRNATSGNLLRVIAKTSIELWRFRNLKFLDTAFQNHLCRCHHFYTSLWYVQCKHLVVGRTKTYTPQPSVDAKGNITTFWNTKEIVDLDARDPAREAPRLPESEWKPTVVTAFSTNHLDVGLLLLRSLGKAASGQSTYNISVVVWTMDEFPPLARRALDCVVEEIKTVYKVPVEVRQFDFGAWPSWMRINQKRGYKGGRGKEHS